MQHNFTDPPFPVHVTSGNAGAPSIDEVDERHCGNASGSTTIPSTRSNSLLPGYGMLTAHNRSHLTWRQMRNSYRGAKGDVTRDLLDEYTVVRTQRGNKSKAKMRRGRSSRGTSYRDGGTGNRGLA